MEQEVTFAKDEATAEDLAVGARLYLECAIAADDKVGMLPGYELVAPFPVMQNVGHAMELAMKSWLKKHDVPYKERKHHSLVVLFSKCLELEQRLDRGFSSVDTGALEHLNNLYEGMVLRYGRGPSTRRVPHFGPVTSMAQDVLLACEVTELEAYMEAG